MKECSNKEEENKKKTKAIYWYTQAMMNARAGNLYIAEGYAKQSIAILAGVNTETIKDCLTDLIEKNGVLIPEVFHESVVRAHMKRCGIDLTNFNPKK